MTCVSNNVIILQAHIPWFVQRYEGFEAGSCELSSPLITRALLKDSYAKSCIYQKSAPILPAFLSPVNHFPFIASLDVNICISHQPVLYIAAGLMRSKCKIFNLKSNPYRSFITQVKSFTLFERLRKQVRICSPLLCRILVWNVVQCGGSVRFQFKI